MANWRLAVLMSGCFCALLGASAAQARPRDDAMAGAYRCGAIGQSRLWLDCYYGAAQPVRAALGLKPAPAAQIALASSPVASSAPPLGDMGVRVSVMTAAAGCGNAADDRQWLDCYYAAAQPMRAMLHLTPAPQAALPVMPVAVARYPAMPVRPASGDSDRVIARMAAYSFSKGGFFTVTLENGQVWRQVNGDTTFAHWKKPAATYLVHIKPGFLESHNLLVQGLPGLYKVLRVS